jgi:hypothetical protein
MIRTLYDFERKLRNKVLKLIKVFFIKVKLVLKQLIVFQI